MFKSRFHVIGAVGLASLIVAVLLLTFASSQPRVIAVTEELPPTATPHPTMLPTITPTYDAAYHRQLGGALSVTPDYPRSLEHLRRAVELEPDNAEYWHMLGTIQREAGQHAFAIESFTKSIELGGGGPYTWLYRGILYYNADDIDAAFADFATVEELGAPNYTIYWLRGQYYESAGDIDAAIAQYSAAYDTALPTRVGEGRLLRRGAMLSMLNGQPEQAERYLLRLHEDDVLQRYHVLQSDWARLGLSHLLQGEVASAFEAFEAYFTPPTDE